MQNGKALIHSSTFWLAIAQVTLAIIIAVQAYLSGFLPEAVVSALLMMKSFLDVYVRVSTTQPITSVLP